MIHLGKLVLLLFAVSFVSFGQKNDQPLVEVYFPASSNLTKIDEQTGQYNQDYRKIAAFLRQANVNADFIEQPWLRALYTTTKRNNAFIVYLDRTKTRENDFTWLLKLGEKNDYVYGPKDIAPEYMSANKLKYYDGIAVCILGSAYCDLFKRLGFKDEATGLLMTSNPEQSAYSIVKAGRGDFFISDQDYFNNYPQLMPDNVKPLFKVNTTATYLAAPKTFDAELLKRFLRE